MAKESSDIPERLATLEERTATMNGRFSAIESSSVDRSWVEKHVSSEFHKTWARQVVWLLLIILVVLVLIVMFPEQILEFITKVRG